jgi:hypothetical protein
MHLGAFASDEIHRMVVGVAAHEHKEVADPVRDTKAQHFAVELCQRLRLRGDESDMAELEHADPDHRVVIADHAPFAEQLDLRAFGVLERQHLRQAGNGTVALFGCDAMFLQFAAQVGEVGVRRHFERQLGAAGLSTLLQFDGEQADLAGQECALALAAGERKPDHLGEMLDRLGEIRCLEGCVADPQHFDHDVRPRSLLDSYLRPTRSISADMPPCPWPSWISLSYSAISILEKSENDFSKSSRV